MGIKSWRPHQYECFNRWAYLTVSLQPVESHVVIKHDLSHWAKVLKCKNGRGWVTVVRLRFNIYCKERWRGTRMAVWHNSSSSVNLLPTADMNSLWTRRLTFRSITEIFSSISVSAKKYSCVKMCFSGCHFIIRVFFLAAAAAANSAAVVYSLWPSPVAVLSVTLTAARRASCVRQGLRVTSALWRRLNLAWMACSAFATDAPAAAVIFPWAIYYAESAKINK